MQSEKILCTKNNNETEITKNNNNNIRRGISRRPDFENSL
jgi:hypothetical protein